MFGTIPYAFINRQNTSLWTKCSLKRMNSSCSTWERWTCDAFANGWSLDTANLKGKVAIFFKSCCELVTSLQVPNKAISSWFDAIFFVISLEPSSSKMISVPKICSSEDKCWVKSKNRERAAVIPIFTRLLLEAFRAAFPISSCCKAFWENCLKICPSFVREIFEWDWSLTMSWTPSVSSNPLIA